MRVCRRWSIIAREPSLWTEFDLTRHHLSDIDLPLQRTNGAIAVRFMWECSNLGVEMGAATTALLLKYAECLRSLSVELWVGPNPQVPDSLAVLHADMPLLEHFVLYGSGDFHGWFAPQGRMPALRSLVVRSTHWRAVHGLPSLTHLSIEHYQPIFATYLPSSVAHPFSTPFIWVVGPIRQVPVT